MSNSVILDGKKIASSLNEETKENIEILASRYKVYPRLDVILVGDNQASYIYVNNKKIACEKIGIRCCVHHFKDDTPPSVVLNAIDKLNLDHDVHGILVQLPLPDSFNKDEIIERISPQKDVDGLHPFNFGRLLIGNSLFVPCTALGCVNLIENIFPSLVGKNIVVVGRSPLVGKPLAMFLTTKNATVTLAHSQSINLIKHTQQADVVVSAIGKPYFFDDTYFSKDCVVIDVGINRFEKKTIVGDVNFNLVVNKVKALTPVPGGVGPMTVAFLLKNTLRAFDSFLTHNSKN